MSMFLNPRMMFLRTTFACAVFAVALVPLFSHAVTVGPAKLQISIDPGQSASGFLYLKNETSQRQTFYPAIQKFSQDANGQKVFTDDAAGISSWMRLPNSVDLGPGEDAEVPFLMETPEDAAPGGHFAVIWWSSSPPGDGGNVSIVTRAGVLVYVRVSGNIVEKGHITNFAGSNRFAWNLPMNFSVDFLNEGNVALTPKGTIRVTNLFGAGKATLPVNPYGGIILPGSNGSFGTLWEGDGFFFGVYKAAINIDYGESDVRSDGDTWWFVMVSPLAAAILVLIIALLFIVPPTVRRYNRWIIDRSRQQF